MNARLETVQYMTRCDQTMAWTALRGHFEGHGRNFDLRQAFARDPARFEHLSLQAPEVFADFSRLPIDLAGLRLLFELARECGLEMQREQLFSGALVNLTEGRAALHTALRAPIKKDAYSQLVHHELERMLSFAEQVRDTVQSGIRHVVNIGIGGSDLGPQMAVLALDAVVHPELQFHFVSNVDGHDLAQVLSWLRPEETLFILASKTFKTQETLANADLAQAWFYAQGGTDFAKHFVATTTCPERATEFGIETVFSFWDWVGGRYSLWSAIGLPLAIAIGETHFRAFLAGAYAMDEHFQQAPLEQNLPAVLGLLDIWQRNFHGYASRCVVPYHHGLRRLPAYLQQLEMESNGKRVDRAGRALTYATNPVVWGEAGTNGQHAFFQLLHQGTETVPVEFLLVQHALHRGSWSLEEEALLDRQQHILLANGLAQAQALMWGKSAEQVLHESRQTLAATEVAASVLAQHRSFPGNRPSLTLLLKQVTPRALGALIALYEHRVFTCGALWGINSFDQWGVELGKALCQDLLPRLYSGDTTGVDSSTAGLIRRLQAV